MTSRGHVIFDPTPLDKITRIILNFGKKIHLMYSNRKRGFQRWRINANIVRFFTYD